MHKNGLWIFRLVCKTVVKITECKSKDGVKLDANTTIILPRVAELPSFYILPTILLLLFAVLAEFFHANFRLNTYFIK